MKKKDIHVAIRNPCHEKFENFTPTEKGGFCMNCQKEVIDFSGMTNQQIIKTLQHTKNTCGRFQEDQLGLLGSVYDKKSNWSFAYLASGFGLISLLVSSNLQAQELNRSKDLRGTNKEKIENKGNAEIKSVAQKIPEKITSNTLQVTSRQVKKENIVITGRIIDANNEALFGAVVLIDGTQHGAVADIDGRFTLDAKQFTGQEITLKVKYIGFQEKVLLLPLDSVNKQIDLKDIVLEDSAVFMGQMIVGAIHYEKKWTPRWIWRKTSTPFRRLYHKVF